MADRKAATMVRQWADKLVLLLVGLLVPKMVVGWDLLLVDWKECKLVVL
jgi:hypothetical protein